MLETPNMKIIKLNEEYLKSTPFTNESFLSEAIHKMAQTVIEADEKLIIDVANEMDISLDSASYYIRKNR